MKYRIITNGKDEFKLQYRWLWFWRTFSREVFEGYEEVIFSSYESACEKLEQWKREDEYNSLKWFTVHEE